MSIRLNKAIRELNIGLQTAVEFLEKKSELGEVKAEPSFKLSDEQYAALAKAFQQDKEVRTQAEKLFQKKPKEKKRTPETTDHRAESVLNENKQTWTASTVNRRRRSLMQRKFSRKKKQRLLP